MTSISQHIPQSLDNQETSPEEKSQASLTAQGVTRRPIWEVIVEIGEQIPDEEWVKVPADASTTYHVLAKDKVEPRQVWEQKQRRHGRLICP